MKGQGRGRRAGGGQQARSAALWHQQHDASAALDACRAPCAARALSLGLSMPHALLCIIRAMKVLSLSHTHTLSLSHSHSLSLSLCLPPPQITPSAGADPPGSEEKTAFIRGLWRRRLGGVQRNVEVWQSLFSVRGLVVPMHEEVDGWLKFTSLCRKSGRQRQVGRHTDGGVLSRAVPSRLVPCSMHTRTARRRSRQRSRLLLPRHNLHNNTAGAPHAGAAVALRPAHHAAGAARLRRRQRRAGGHAGLLQAPVGDGRAERGSVTVRTARCGAAAAARDAASWPAAAATPACPLHWTTHTHSA